MKPTKSILILLSLFLVFSCDKENPVITPLVCSINRIEIDGECECTDGFREIYSGCYFQKDLDVLQNIINLNDSLDSLVVDPLNLGSRQYWKNGRLLDFDLSNSQLSVLPENIGDLDSLNSLRLGHNQITMIPNSLWNLNLTHLTLTTNELTSISEEILSSPSELVSPH